ITAGRADQSSRMRRHGSPLPLESQSFPVLPDGEAGRVYHAGMLLTLPFNAAARITSPNDASNRLRDPASDEAARLALPAMLPDSAALQRRLNAALTAHRPESLRKHLQPLAVGLVLDPSHGSSVCRGAGSFAFPVKVILFCLPKKDKTKKPR